MESYEPKECSVTFNVHNTGAITLDNVRFGPSTAVARALIQVAKQKDDIEAERKDWKRRGSDGANQPT